MKVKKNIKKCRKSTQHIDKGSCHFPLESVRIAQFRGDFSPRSPRLCAPLGRRGIWLRQAALCPVCPLHPIINCARARPSPQIQPDNDRDDFMLESFFSFRALHPRQ
jgi:hypothetical protein